MDRGYLENKEDRKGRPARLVAGDDLPGDIEILPAPERLQGCTVASDSGGIKTNNLSGLAETAQEKEFSSTPSDKAATVQPRDLNARGVILEAEDDRLRKGGAA